MLKRRGQAASWLLHIAGELVLGLLLAALVAAGALAWRLAEGPIDLSFLAPRLSAALSGGPDGAVVRIRAASLAWEGFRKGIESPLDLVLADTVLTSRHRSGSIIIPRAELSLSAPALLLGRIAPRWIAIEAPRLHIVIGQPGGPALFFGGRGTPARPSAATARLAGAVLDALNASPGADRRGKGMRFPALSELRTLTIRDAEVTVVDPKLPATWFAPDANIRLRRGSQGGLFGHARMAVGLGGHALLVAVEGHLETHRRLSIAAHISAVRPKDLATLAPILRPLKAVDAPVSLELELAFGANFTLRSAHLSAEAKTGRLTFAGGNVPIAGGSLEIAAAGKDALRVRKAVLDLAATQHKPGPVLHAAGSAFRDAGGTWHGTLAVAADRVPMADLGRYWPPDIARGGRKWVTENITAGTAERARAAVRFAFAPRSDRLVLEGAYGQIPASGLVVHWLRPIPPLTDGKATLSIEGPDALLIAVQHARDGRLEVSDGKVSITGLEEKDQNLVIAGRVAGPLQDALALLAQPRLGLLSRHKLPFSNAGGNADTSISVRLPLLANVTMDQVAVHANATLDQVRLGNVSGTFGLAQGAFTLTADNNEMNIKGAAALAGIPTGLSYTMDFDAGPPASVNQRLLADATVTTSQLAGLHILDATSLIDGPVALSAELDIARDGAAKARIGAGLKETRLAIAPLGFVKPAGAPATAHAEIVFSRQKIAAIHGFTLTGAGISVAGQASFTNGLPSFIRIDRAAIGRTEGSGSVRFPQDGQPVTIALAGPVLDLSQHFVHPAPARERAGATRKPAEKTLPWVLDARFGRTLLAHGRELTDCALAARSNGTMITEAHFKANLGKSEPLSLSLASGPPGRTLSVTTADAGALLAALDITQRIAGGALTLSAQLDGTAANEPLAGTARISSFRVKNAPVLGKVLQAMTLYGLADAMSGPGLAFSELVAPFRLANNILTLQAARAFSASLGLTADGTINFGNDSTRLTGTVVPAYFFNSLLGRIPFIGRLFSPEKGSGLFAATYSVDGPLANPRVSVNPLAALTPGFLRGLFHIFD